MVFWGLGTPPLYKPKRISPARGPPEVDHVDRFDEILDSSTKNLTFFQIEDEEEAADDNHVPRSPVPLPDVSTCKPILVQLGFSLSARAKKCKF